MDWSPTGTRAQVRKFLEDPTWGEGNTGIRAGRDVAKQIMETWYAKQQRPSRGIRGYEDYREMLERERDIQGIVNITPDHQHAAINITALSRQGGDLAQAGREGLCTNCAKRCERRARARPPASARLQQQPRSPHARDGLIHGGAIGQVREVHNWTNRPFWPQGMQEYHASGPAVLGWLQLDAVARAGTGSSVSSQLHVHRSIAAGARVSAPVASPTWGITACGSRIASSTSACRSSSRRGRTTRLVDGTNVSKGGYVSLIGFPTREHDPLASSGDGESSGDRYVLGMTAATSRKRLRNSTRTPRIWPTRDAVHRRQRKDPL